MRLLPALLALVCCAAVPAAATAASIPVDPGGSVQAAVDAAAPGDTVQLTADGTYPGPVVVTKPLAVAGPAGATLSAPGAAQVLDVRDADVTLSGFTVEASGSATGILARTTTPAPATVTVRGLTVRGHAADGLVARAAGLELVAEDLAISGAGAGAGAPQHGVVVEDGAVATIRRGTISSHCGGSCAPADGQSPSAPAAAGVLALGSGASGVTVVGTTIVDNLVGVRGAGARRLDVLDARLAGNGTGVQVVDAQEGAPAAATQGVVHGTAITGGTHGVQVHDGTAGAPRPAPVLRADRIVGQTGAGVAADVPVTATDVWWGCNGGPGAPGCSAVTAGVDAGRHLVLALRAGPGSGGAAATLTADVTRNAEGVASGGAFPDGTPVAFATDRGTVSPAVAPTTAGTAGATLTAGAESGTATTSATLDGQTVSVPVAVTGTTPVPAPTATPVPRPTDTQLLTAARKAIGRDVVRLTRSLEPGVAYVDRSVRTGSGTLTIADKDVVSLMVLACPERACDAGVSAKVERTSKAGRKLTPYALRRATFSLQAGRQRVVAVRLTAAQRKGIKRVRTATMVVVAAVSGPGGDRSKQTLRLKLRIRAKSS